MPREKVTRISCAAVAALVGPVGLLRTLREPFAPSFWRIFFLLAAGVLSAAAVYFALGAADRRAWTFSLPLGVLLGLFAACGVELYRVDRLNNSLGGIAGRLFSALCFGSVLAAGIALLVVHLPRLAAGRPTRFSPRTVFFVSWGTMILCWLPCFIAFFPGIFAYDIPTQLIGISEGTLTSDHPLLHTIIAWACMKIGAAIRSYSLGAALYTLVQMLTLSASYAASLAYLCRRGASTGWLAGSLAFFALLPVHPLFAVNATKDVLFAACVIFFLLFAAELIRRPAECLRSPRFWNGYTAVVLAMALMRNTGIYVFILFIPVMLAALPRRRLLALGLALLSLVLFFGTQAGLRAGLDIQPGRFTEALSVPLQQMARCAYDNALDEDELAELQKYIPHEVWRTYSSRLADQIKNTVDREVIKADPLGLLSLWLRMGLRHSGCYLNAFLGLNIGYWYPDMVYPDTRTWHAYIECDTKWINDEIRITDPNLWPEAREFYRGIGLGANFEPIPLLDLLFKPGIYLWLTLTALAASIYHRSRSAAFLLIFLSLSWLLQLFSPIALLRYVYPFMTALPLAAGLIRKKE
ncbi:MAG: hypothetical protein IKL84_05530 [Clostridia bacterium]|nr:hypothetical protein [Clostridia bacterium]